MIKVQPTVCGGDTTIFALTDDAGATQDVVRIYGDLTAELVNSDRLNDLPHAELVELVRQLVRRDDLEREKQRYDGGW
jgi:hypothetical protein